MEALRNELDALATAWFDADPEGASNEFFGRACDVADALSWVLGELASETFGSERHLNLSLLRKKAGSGPRARD